MKAATGRGWRWMARLALLLGLCLPAGGAQAAPAQDFTIAGEWEITFEVRSGAPRVFWIGRVWDYSEDAAGELIAQRRVDISADCAVQGAPIFGENDVTFDGVDDYITCEIPNFPALFATMSPQLANCRCFYEGPPYAAADISPAYSTEPLPVVYHHRLFLEVINRDMKSLRLPVIKTLAPSWLRDAVRMDANNNLGLAKLTLQFFNDEVLTQESNLFNVGQANGFQIWAGYEATRYIANASESGWASFLAESGFWDAVQPAFDTGFFIWESEALGKYVDEAMPSGFGLGPGTLIYIGHNPDKNSFYRGTMRAVAVDPGCRGH